MNMETIVRSPEGQRLWDAAQGTDNNLLGEGFTVLGARALSMFRANGVETILVLGCGRGGDERLFAKKGFCVEAVDFSSLDWERGDRSSKVETRRCGALLARNIRDKLPAPRSSIDAIFSTLLTCMDLREEEIKDLMWECLKVLKPGGLITLSVFSEHSAGCEKTMKCGEDEWVVDRGFVSHFFNEDKIKRIAQGFKILWIHEYEEEESPASGAFYEIVLMKPK